VASVPGQTALAPARALAARDINKAARNRRDVESSQLGSLARSFIKMEEYPG